MTDPSSAPTGAGDIVAADDQQEAPAEGPRRATLGAAAEERREASPAVDPRSWPERPVTTPTDVRPEGASIADTVEWPRERAPVGEEGAQTGGMLAIYFSAAVPRSNVLGLSTYPIARKFRNHSWYFL